MASSTGAERGEVLNIFKNSLPADIHGLDIRRITELFGEFGYVCKTQGKLRGISGNLHEFDFVCTKLDTGEKIILDSFLKADKSEESQEIEMVKIRLKTYDCSPDICIVIAPSLTPSMRDMASLYRISLIEAAEEKGPYDQLESLLRLREGDSKRKNPMHGLA